MPLSNPLAEEERTAIEPHASFPEEAEPVQLRVRFSSSTSSGEQMGCNSINHFIGSEIHGDSGVEADLSALNLHEDDTYDYSAQELDDEGGEGAMLHLKSIELVANIRQGTHENVNVTNTNLGENPAQGYQKKKGKGTRKKEVMMSFGVVKYDVGGVRQELKQTNVIKEDGGACDETRRLEERQHLQITMPEEVRGPGH